MPELVKQAPCFCHKSCVRWPQGGESSGEVWEAALGCLLHMCCRDGAVAQPDVCGLPPATARALLHCCREHGWCGHARRTDDGPTPHSTTGSPEDCCVTLHPKVGSSLHMQNQGADAPTNRQPACLSPATRRLYLCACGASLSESSCSAKKNISRQHTMQTPA